MYVGSEFSLLGTHGGNHIYMYVGSPLPCEACAAGQGVPPTPGKACWPTAGRGLASDDPRQPVKVCSRSRRAHRAGAVRRGVPSITRTGRRHQANRSAGAIASVACRLCTVCPLVFKQLVGRQARVSRLGRYVTYCFTVGSLISTCLALLQSDHEYV